MTDSVEHVPVRLEPVDSIVLPSVDAAVLARMVDGLDDVTLDEAKARARLRALVRLDDASKTGTISTVPGIPEGALVVLTSDADFDVDEQTALLEELARRAGHAQFTLVYLASGESLDVIRDADGTGVSV